MIAVSVTDDDIKEGIRNNAALCPVALAVRRAMNVRRLAKVWVHFSKIIVAGKVFAYDEAATPREVKKFMKDFNGKRRVYPFEFELEFKEKKVDDDTPVYYHCGVI